MPTKIDEFSRQIGALETGVHTLGKSLDDDRTEARRERAEDREENRRFREAMQTTVASLAEAVRTQSKQLEITTGEISKIKVDASVLRSSFDDRTKRDDIRLAEIKGAAKFGKAIYAAIAVIATMAGTVGGITTDIIRHIR